MNRQNRFFIWALTLFLGITLTRDTCFSNGGDVHGEAVSGGAEVVTEEGGTHKAPHGGEVKILGDKHVEFVVHRHNTGYRLQIYLLDIEENTLPVTGIDCTLFLAFADSSRSVLPSIKQTATDKPSYFEAAIEETKPLDKVVVSLVINGQRHNLRYGVPSEGKVEHPDKKIEEHDEHMSLHN